MQLGRIKEGDIVPVQFVIRNLHPWPVTVQSINGTCGCTKTFSEPTPFVLRPAQSTVVKLAFDTEGKAGAVRQVANIVTDGKNVTHLTMEGEIVK